jgi:hypothetical protein
LSHIDIYYVNFEIETVISVDCNDFHNAFSTEIKNISIIDKKILTQFEHEFKSLKLANSDMPTPDTRIQIKAYRGENVELYCIGQFTIIKNDELYNFSDSFRGLLEKINVIR